MKKNKTKQKYPTSFGYTVLHIQAEKLRQPSVALVLCHVNTENRGSEEQNSLPVCLTFPLIRPAYESMKKRDQCPDFWLVHSNVICRTAFLKGLCHARIFLHMSTPSPFLNSSIFRECESQLSSIKLCTRVNTRHIHALHLGGNGYNIF